VAVALDEQGTARAFITLIPVPARRGWMLDLMRRRADASGGAMELLIARTAEYLRERGNQTFSLSLAPLASTHPSDEDTAAVVRRARKFLYEHFDHLYNYRSLQRFKDKFNPRWDERFLAYPTGETTRAADPWLLRPHASAGTMTSHAIGPRAPLSRASPVATNHGKHAWHVVFDSGEDRRC
jgi:lysylphosphatidylglycerol synthetase-like protein (DUF2156 family)